MTNQTELLEGFSSFNAQLHFTHKLPLALVVQTVYLQRKPFLVQHFSNLEYSTPTVTLSAVTAVKDDLDNLTIKSGSCPRGDCVKHIFALVSPTLQVVFQDKTLTTNFGNTSAMQEAPHLFLTTSTLVICSASCKTAHLHNQGCIIISAGKLVLANPPVTHACEQHVVKRMQTIT